MSAMSLAGELVRMAKRETLLEAIAIVEANVPRNERGDYWGGRFAAADELRKLLESEEYAEEYAEVPQP